MKSITKHLLLLLTVLSGISLWAQSPADSIAMPPFDTVAQKVYANQLPYQTLAIRAKMVWNDGQIEQAFQGNIRMQKDSLIWLSLIGPFGIEGARVMVTPDTFKILNKLMGEYSVKEFNFLEKWMYLPLSFTMLQQVITGQKADINEKATAIGVEDSLYVLYYETDKMQQKLWVHPQNYTIVKMLLKDKMLQQNMIAKFEGYNMVNGLPFSYKRSVEIMRNGATMRLSIDMTKVTCNEPGFYPFEINNGYKKVE